MSDDTGDDTSESSSGASRGSGGGLPGLDTLRLLARWEPWALLLALVVLAFVFS
ncbi:hypothetical protein [Streptomyces sp. BBFR2]|uniref:hypothetical protein n=1 Tax=Streptomyces sp. BBFR2 TaxID=3372854 RepID=UPI0037DA770C